MTRTTRKLLAAAALTTAAAPGVAAASPAATPTAATTTAARTIDPPEGCMLRLWDPVAKSYWFVGNGKNMPDQASLATCTKLQAVLTEHARAAKAPVTAPVRQVSRAEWAKAATRVLRPAVATTAGK